MSSENKTAVLGLNQWAGNENPKREDFNADNLSIENAFVDHLNENATETLEGHVQFATVTETGAGALNNKAVHPEGLKAVTSPLRYAMTEITTSETLVIGRANSRLKCNSASLITITVPPNSSTAFTIGDEIEFVQYGTGTVTFQAGSGVTIRSKDSKLSIGGQYSAASLLKIGTDEWLLIGSLTT